MTDSQKQIVAEIQMALRADRPLSLASLARTGNDERAVDSGRYSRHLERVICWLEFHVPASLEFSYLQLEEIVEDAAAVPDSAARVDGAHHAR